MNEDKYESVEACLRRKGRACSRQDIFIEVSKSKQACKRELNALMVRKQIVKFSIRISMHPNQLCPEAVMYVWNHGTE